jgi:hypothetical protein
MRSPSDRPIALDRRSHPPRDFFDQLEGWPCALSGGGLGPSNSTLAISTSMSSGRSVN